MGRLPRFVVYPLAGACGYAAIYFAAGRAVYHPLRYPEGFWEAQAEIPAQDVWLRARDGVRLHAWWVDPPGARIATLFLHGNGGNITHRVRTMREIAAAGSAVLALDYRGYGRSEGRPTERGIYADADAAYNHLDALGRPIVIHGESLGSAVAVDLAARRPCAALILEAPFTSANAMAGRVLQLLGPLVIFSYDSTRKIRRIRAPLLVMHGAQDDIVPIEFGRALFDSAPEPKTFWAVPGAGHNNLLEAAGRGYGERLRAIYRSIGRQT
jgi:fermentation-respiration switch protein FrsA (DUF1100 family)